MLRAIHGFIHFVERNIKGPTWHCQMCGQCILRSTGLTCPMNCPKHLRNGPCGGVRANGKCEVDPARDCTWVKIWRRARKLGWEEKLLQIQPPLDHRLVDTASWFNLVTRQIDIDGHPTGRYLGWFH